MMNKQEVIEKIEACKSPFTSEDDTIFNYGLDKALSIIKQLDEPEKPVVPQFVADMIIERKKQKQGIVTAIRNLSVFKEAFAWISKNEEAFAKAWFYGYEVEKEKLYTVELPNHNSDGSMHIILIKTEEGICIDCYSSISYRNLSIAQLTEAEIKEDFDWAWQFAEEVEK